MTKVVVELGDLIDIYVTCFTGSFESDYLLDLFPDIITVDDLEEYRDRYRNPPYGEEDLEEINDVLDRMMRRYKTSLKKRNPHSSNTKVKDE